MTTIAERIEEFYAWEPFRNTFEGRHPAKAYLKKWLQKNGWWDAEYLPWDALHKEYWNGLGVSAHQRPTTLMMAVMLYTWLYCSPYTNKDRKPPHKDYMPLLNALVKGEHVLHAQKNDAMAGVMADIHCAVAEMARKI